MIDAVCFRLFRSHSPLRRAGGFGGIHAAGHRLSLLREQARDCCHSSSSIPCAWASPNISPSLVLTTEGTVITAAVASGDMACWQEAHYAITNSPSSKEAAGQVVPTPSVVASAIVKWSRPKLLVRRPLRQASPMLEKESSKQEVPVMLPTPTTSGRIRDFQKKWTETLPGSEDRTYTMIKNCKCKNSKCLKLYCECFATGRYCDGCNCTDCFNNINYNSARQDAKNVVLRRNLEAFSPKVGNKPPPAHKNEDKPSKDPLADKHTRGCSCRRLECLKKYCSCFQSNVLCSENCRCMDCKNYESNEDRVAIRHVTQKRAVFVQHVKNNESSGMLGPSSALHTAENDSVISMSASGSHQPFISNVSSKRLVSSPTFHMEDSDSVMSERNSKSHTKLGPVEVAHRTLVTDIIQVKDVNKICNF